MAPACIIFRVAAKFVALLAAAASNLKRVKIGIPFWPLAPNSP